MMASLSAPLSTQSLVLTWVLLTFNGCDVFLALNDAEDTMRGRTFDAEVPGRGAGVATLGTGLRTDNEVAGRRCRVLLGFCDNVEGFVGFGGRPMRWVEAVLRPLATLLLDLAGRGT